MSSTSKVYILFLNIYVQFNYNSGSSSGKPQVPQLSSNFKTLTPISPNRAKPDTYFAKLHYYEVYLYISIIRRKQKKN